MGRLHFVYEETNHDDVDTSSSQINSEQAKVSFNNLSACYKSHAKANLEEENEGSRDVRTDSSIELGDCNSLINPFGECYDVNSPFLHTDGPILSKKEIRALQQAGNNCLCLKLDSPLRDNDVRDNKLDKQSSRLSLSPLGPKHSRKLTRTLEDKYASNILTSSNARDIISPMKALFEEHGLEKAVKATLDYAYTKFDREFKDLYHDVSLKEQTTCPRSAMSSCFLSQCSQRHIKSTGRSLVGSFEESLISGCLLAGKGFQVPLNSLLMHNQLVLLYDFVFGSSQSFNSNTYTE